MNGRRVSNRLREKKSIKNTLARAQIECDQAGVKLTEKRLNVLAVLLKQPGAVSAYQVIDDYKAEFQESLQAMSVYRMLNFLVDTGLAHRLETTNQYIACSHILCDHDHEIPQFLICQSCSQVTEVGLRKELIDELRSSVSDLGFTLNNQQLELHGICSACRKKPAKN